MIWLKLSKVSKCAVLVLADWQQQKHDGHCRRIKTLASAGLPQQQADARTRTA